MVACVPLEVAFVTFVQRRERGKLACNLQFET